MTDGQGQTPQPTGSPLSKGLTYGSLGIALLIMIGLGVIFYYWYETPTETVLIAPRSIPPGVSPGFGPDELGNHLVVALQNLGKASQRQQSGKQTAATGPQFVKLPPLVTTAGAPLPIFDVEVHGISFRKLRAMGIAWKAHSLLEIDVTGSPESKFRISGVLKEKPNYDVRGQWSAPKQGACGQLDPCVGELAEGIYAVLAPRALVSLYWNADTIESYKKVARLYQASLSSTGLAEEDYLVWGTALLKSQRDSDAHKIYDALLQRTPTYCHAHLVIGNTYLERYTRYTREPDDLDRAETAFRDAVRCDPQSAAACNNLGNVVMRKWSAGGKKDARLSSEAMQLFERANGLDAALAEPVVNIGYLKYQEGKTEEALRYFEDFSPKFPKSASLFLNYGFLLYLEYRKGKLDALPPAVEKTTQAWTLDNNNYGAANNLGFFSYELGSLTEAEKYLELASHLNPNSADTLTGLALVRYRQGKPQEALDLYAKALKCDPKSSDAEYLRKVYLWGPHATADIAPLSKEVARGQTHSQ